MNCKAGSCKIGFNPNPSFISIELTKKGLEAKITYETKNKYKERFEKKLLIFLNHSSNVLLKEKKKL